MESSVDEAVPIGTAGGGQLESTGHVEVRGIRKTFRQGSREITALDDINLDIESGEIVAIMGASGSGKSSLLNVIAGITAPDAGEVRINGSDITSLRDPQLTLFRRKHIGLIFQSFNLIPTLSALDNVQLPILAGGEQGALTANQLLDRIGLSDRIHHHPDALSGGEQQRIAIARALITNPSVILADEPTGSLDSITGESICRLLKELSVELGRTVVIVTHEPAVAVWADRVIVLKDGRLLNEFRTTEFANAQDLATHYHAVITEPSGRGEAQ